MERPRRIKYKEQGEKEEELSEEEAKHGVMAPVNLTTGMLGRRIESEA